MMKKAKFALVLNTLVFNDIISTITQTGPNPKGPKDGPSINELLKKYPCVLYYNLYLAQRENLTEQFKHPVTNFYKRLTMSNRRKGVIEGKAEDYELVPIKVFPTIGHFIVQSKKILVVSFGTYASHHYRNLLKRNVRFTSQYVLPEDSFIKKHYLLATSPDLVCMIGNTLHNIDFLQTKEEYKNKIDNKRKEEEEQARLQELEQQALKSLDRSFEVTNDTNTSSDSDSSLDTDEEPDPGPAPDAAPNAAPDAALDAAPDAAADADPGPAPDAAPDAVPDAAQDPDPNSNSVAVGRKQSNKRTTSTTSTGRRKSSSQQSSSTPSRKRNSETLPDPPTETKKSKNNEIEESIAKYKQKELDLLARLELITYDLKKEVVKSSLYIGTNQRNCEEALNKTRKHTNRLVKLIKRKMDKLSGRAKKGKKEMYVLLYLYYNEKHFFH